jgi:hypothetical protein
MMATAVFSIHGCHGYREPIAVVTAIGLMAILICRWPITNRYFILMNDGGGNLESVASLSQNSYPFMMAWRLIWTATRY